MPATGRPARVRQAPRRADARSARPPARRRARPWWGSGGRRGRRRHRRPSRCPPCRHRGLRAPYSAARRRQRVRGCDGRRRAGLARGSGRWSRISLVNGITIPVLSGTGTQVPIIGRIAGREQEHLMTGQDTARDRRWIALILLCVAQFVVVLDASIVNVALPTIGDALNFSESQLPWVVNAYVLTFGGFLLLGGRMADLLGRRRVFMGGLVLFALASLAGGLATTSGQLIAARAVQGLGAAILSPAALSIVTTTFQDGAERNKALGVWGAVAGSGGAAGVLLGGALTDGLGWEWVLWVNVPIGLIAAAISPMLLAESRSTGDRRHFDVAGAFSVTAGLSLLVYALVDANSAGWGSAQTIGLLAISAALLAAFGAIERRAPAPLVPV